MFLRRFSVACVLLCACLEPNPDHDGLGPAGEGTSTRGEGESGDSASDASGGESGSGSQTGGDGDESGGDGDGTSGGDGDGDELCAMSQSALVLCHTFENLRGTTFEDLSGNSNDVTATEPLLEAGVSPTTQAIVGGESQAYSITDSATLDLDGAFTFEFWLRPDSGVDEGRRGVIDKDGQYSVMQLPEGIQCGSSAIGHVIGAPPIGQWTYVACTWDGSELVLYFDGLEVASNAASGSLPVSNTEPMAVLDSSPTFDEPFDGRLDALRIWNAALSASEICAQGGQNGC